MNKEILVRKAMMGIYMMLKQAQNNNNKEIIKEIQTAIKKVKGE